MGRAAIQRAQVSIQVPEGVRSTLSQIARQERMTLSEVVRLFIEPSVSKRKTVKKNQKRGRMHHRFEAGTLYLSFEDLKSSTINQVQRELDQCLKEYEAEKIVFLQVDLSQATFVDSMGLNFLVFLAKRMEEKQIKFEINISSPWIMRIFKMMKIDKWMNCRMTK